jgi:arginyl-tRNA--protein-N-Asp/Glu arginylyltransferase
MSEKYFSYQTHILQEGEQASDFYNQGFVFTRLAKGEMNQIRSLRVDLSKFSLNSENRRILRKNEDLNIELKKLPLENYSWEIHKMGKEFYSQKFGDGTMSAAKIKEMFTNLEESNMNGVFTYQNATGHWPLANSEEGSGNSYLEGRRPETRGYCLCYFDDKIIHYAYPFYDLSDINTTLGIGMMTMAINYAKENGFEYIYLGSVADKSAKYKLQFDGLEWWDNDSAEWSDDINQLKDLLE